MKSPRHSVSMDPGGLDRGGLTKAPPLAQGLTLREGEGGRGDVALESPARRSVQSGWVGGVAPWWGGPGDD